MERPIPGNRLSRFSVWTELKNHFDFDADSNYFDVEPLVDREVGLTVKRTYPVMTSGKPSSARVALCHSYVN